MNDTGTLSAVAPLEQRATGERCSLAEGLAFSVGLYRESGEKPGVVLFLADDKDWDSRHLNRHGDRLAGAISPPECVAFRDQGFRARSLHYNGAGRQRAAGLDEDLARLGFDAPTRARFLAAAESHWPNEQGLP